jgi:putative membrane protein insertion efficiency factor
MPMFKAFFVGLINFYQAYLRCIFPCACRFSPSCSDYAKLAIVKYGILRGSMMALKRILCCHPFSKKTGYDPLI